MREDSKLEQTIMIYNPWKSHKSITLYTHLKTDDFFFLLAIDIDMNQRNPFLLDGNSENLEV